MRKLFTAAAIVLMSTAAFATNINLLTAYASYEVYNDRCEKLPPKLVARMIVVNLDRISDAELNPVRREVKAIYAAGPIAFCSTLKPAVDTNLSKMLDALN